MTADAAARLEAAVRRGSTRRTAAVLRGLDEDARTALRPHVTALGKQLDARLLPWDSASALDVARVGTTGGAGPLARVLRQAWHPDLWAQVVLDRDPPWLPQLVERMAAVAPERGRETPWFSLLEQLRRGAGVPRPVAEPYLRGLLLELADAPDLPAALHRDDEVRGLLPAALAAPDSGGALRERSAHRRTGEPRPPEQDWPAVLAAMAGEGSLDRAQLLDLVLDVLLRGGTRLHLAAHAAVHDALAPSDEELLARLRTYLRLVADGTGPVAGRTLARLRALEDRLDEDAVAEALEAGLLRREKGVATAALAWLGRREPVPALQQVAVRGLEHERADVQEQALVLLARWAPLDPAVEARVAALRYALPLALRPAVDALVPGGPSGEPGRGAAAAATSSSTPATPSAPAASAGPRAPAPAPLPDLRALARALRPLLEHDPLPAPREAELALDVLAREGADRAALVAALRPVAGLVPERLHTTRPDGVRALRWLLHDLLHGVSFPQAEARRRLRDRFRQPPRSGWPVPPGAARGPQRPRPRGRRPARPRHHRTAARHPDPRLRAAGGGGARGARRAAGRARRRGRGRDTEQALLRLPRAAWAGPLAERLARGGPAARSLAQRLRGPRPEPLLRVVPLPDRDPLRGQSVRPDHRGRPVVSAALPEGFPLVPPPLTDPLLVACDGAWALGSPPSALVALLALPADRELAAAHLVASALDAETGLVPDDREVLVLLPEADGPAGPATALALARAAASADGPTRTACADALLGFADRGGLEPAPLGGVLAGLLLDEDAKAGRVAGVLADVVRGPAPAPALVWQVLASALPALLARPPRALHAVLEVATEAALAVGAHDVLPGLDALAAGRGGTRLHDEARRLRAALAT